MIALRGKTWSGVCSLAFTAGVLVLMGWAGEARAARRGPPAAQSAHRPHADHREISSALQNGPSPRLTPVQVVQAQMKALQHNDQPQPDSGIATTFRYASPNNRRMTGPLPHFIQIVKTTNYLPMLNFKSATYEKAEIRGHVAVVRVHIVSARNQRLTYIFILSRQNNAPYKDCWMTDGVQLDRRPSSRKDI